MEPQIGVCAAISYPLIYVFGFLALVESLYSVVGGIEYSRLLRKWINRCPGDFAPPATLIVPCRGIDPGLEANLSAYFETPSHPPGRNQHSTFIRYLQIVFLRETSLSPPPNLLSGFSRFRFFFFVLRLMPD